VVTGTPLLVEPVAPPEAKDTVPSVQLESQLAMHWPQPFAPEVAEKLVVLRETDPDAVDQYRKLAAALQSMQRERRIRIVMIASANDGEGKTLTATNLALTLSESSRVLLVDADLRHPRIHQIFQVSAFPGLNEGLQSASEHRMPVIEVTRNLVLLRAGRPAAEPEKLLGSESMRQVLSEAGTSFDYVIVDTPPVLAVPDASTLVGMVDVAILVVDARKTPNRVIERAIETLGRDRVAGVVVNRA
jgi:capsular exopolysaccharide synthesis family protein